MKAPLPPDERERLQALRRYAILDTPQEVAFDRITRLAARLLKVPVTTVSLVDESRQWFKSSYGMEVRETSRELSFCSHAILSDEVTVVPDATGDQRFLDNELVTGEPHIRFYAGAPLESSDGFKLGTLCAIDTRPRQFTDEEREVLHDLAAIVTHELEMRLAMRERTQLAAAISHLKSGVVVTDPALPDGPIVFANRHFLDLTGYGSAETIGHNCRFLQGPETNPETVARIREAIASRRTFQEEILNYRKDGTPFWNDLTVSPVLDDSGQLISFVGLQTDVTERRRLRDELQQSFEKLKELESLRDNLTHMIIHDLRAPLTAIIGFLELLEGAAAARLTPKEMQFITIANEGANTLQEMITSLLDVNRLEAGEMPLKCELADLRDVITAATDPLRSLLGGRSLICSLPPAPVEVRCDAELVSRVITNLVSNAIKFTSATDEIRVVLAPSEERVKISIADTGAGIPRHCLDRIFDKFGQIEGRKNRHSTGLGLTFCKLAVEAQGGTIGVESVEGEGATFWFVLPVADGGVGVK